MDCVLARRRGKGWGGLERSVCFPRFFGVRILIQNALAE